jgi:hypothetical protein
MSDREKREAHPSFGVIGLYRQTTCGIQARNKLFGSSLSDHPETIVIKLNRATRKHDLGRDWIYADSIQPLFSVELSPAQFAAMITTMNVGDGVPCTVRVLNREPVDEMPAEYETEAEKTRNYYGDSLRERLDKLSSERKRLSQVLSKKKLTKKDKEEVAFMVEKVFRMFEGDAEFMLGQFERAAERVVVAAKGQVDAFITSTAARLGIEALREKFKAPEIVAAPELSEAKSEVG